MTILLIGLAVLSFGLLLSKANKPSGEVITLVGAAVTLLGALGILLHYLPTP